MAAAPSEDGAGCCEDGRSRSNRQTGRGGSENKGGAGPPPDQAQFPAMLEDIFNPKP